MKKFYIEDSPFLYDDLSKWETLLPYIEEYGDFIEVVEGVLCNTDKECRIKTKELLSREPDHFYNCQPVDVTISMSPFLIKNDYISVCFKYKIDAHVLFELKETWLKELKETMVMSFFVVYSKDKPILWVNFFGVVMLLSYQEKQIFQKAGFKLKEYNIFLNESLYALGLQIETFK